MSDRRDRMWGDRAGIVESDVWWDYLPNPRASSVIQRCFWVVRAGTHSQASHAAGRKKQG